MTSSKSIRFFFAWLASRGIPRNRKRVWISRQRARREGRQEWFVNKSSCHRALKAYRPSWFMNQSLSLSRFTLNTSVKAPTRSIDVRPISLLHAGPIRCLLSLWMSLWKRAFPTWLTGDATYYSFALSNHSRYRRTLSGEICLSSCSSSLHAKLRLLWEAKKRIAKFQSVVGNGILSLL